jgi:hypothetical protein
LDRAAAALGRAQSATFAVVVIELKSFAGAKLEDGVVRTDAISLYYFVECALGREASRAEYVLTGSQTPSQFEQKSIIGGVIGRSLHMEEISL